MQISRTDNVCALGFLWRTVFLCNCFEVCVAFVQRVRLYNVTGWRKQKEVCKTRSVGCTALMGGDGFKYVEWVRFCLCKDLGK